MALWGKTDNLAGTPKFVARKAYFAASKVNTTSNQIDILASNTGFATGDAVVYNNGGGTSITNLTNNGTYYVRVDGAGLISLYDTYAHAIAYGSTTGLKDLAGSPTGTQSLQRTGAANEYGDHVNNGRGIFFVDKTEAMSPANKAKGITGAGWWQYRTYTDANSNTRHKAECLVALTVDVATSGDAEDTVVVDPVISISAQPGNASVTAPAPATFSVTASVTTGMPLTYQWQIQQEGAGSWANVSGATSASYTTGATATGDGAGATDGDKYRVVISSEGAADVTSNAATLTVA